MKTLKEIIGNRPIAILLHGSSIETLENRIIIEFKDLDFCYISINYFKVMESRILSKINKKLNLVYCSNYKEFITRKEDIEEFVSRENTKLLTTFECLWQTENEDFVNKYFDKIHICKMIVYENNTYPNSLAVLLYNLIREGFYKIILFGCDGLLDKEEDNIDKISNTYFGKEQLKREERDWNLINDTKNFNRYFREALWRKLKEEEYSPKLNIVNCSPNSYIKVFNIITYDRVEQWYAENQNNTLQVVKAKYYE